MDFSPSLISRKGIELTSLTTINFSVFRRINPCKVIMQERTIRTRSKALIFSVFGTSHSCLGALHKNAPYLTKRQEKLAHFYAPTADFLAEWRQYVKKNLDS